MADRVLRGSRLGAVSYETDRNHDLAPRQVARYRTDNGEEFDVPFADDAEIPAPGRAVTGWKAPSSKVTFRSPRR